MRHWQSLIENHRKLPPCWLDSLQNQNAWIDLQAWTLLIVEGPDAEKYLQGQLTCDLKESEGKSILTGAHCNPKGRILSSFDLIKINSQTFALRLHSSIAESALLALKKYIVFSKANISISEKYQLVGFYADAPCMTALNIELPETGKFSEHAGHFLLRHTDKQWELWAPVEAEAPAAFFESLNRLREDQWSLLDIRAGKAELRAETVEQFLPQELNFQLIGAVSFKKGCYTGQEIVARLHYKGNLKKHLYRICFTAEQTPVYLQALEESEPATETKKVGKKVGTLVCFAACSEHQYEALALCNDAASGSKNVTLATNKLQWASLPYAIPG